MVLQWAFVCLMLLVLGGGLSLGGHLLEEKREFCLTCHEMKPLGDGYYASRASRDPVEAPEGTIAEPWAPLSSRTSTITVGFPRESNTSLARISEISLIVTPP